jgi:hypothetical protein
MNKMEAKKLTDKIKGYYNSQFFIDEYVIDAWYETMKPYDLEDAIEHIQSYTRDYPDTPPRPHTFKRGLYTTEEKERMRNANYTIECNLCHRWISIQDYDDHYSKCLDITYLVDVAKQKGEEYSREDLENCTDKVIERLISKYPPKKLAINEVFTRL